MVAAVAGAWRATGGSFALVVTANSATETRTITLTSGREYWLTGDTRVDSSAGDGDLLAIIAAAIAGHSELSSCTLTLVEGRVRVTTDIAASLDWSAGATTLDPTLLGFTSTDTASATTIDAPSTCPYIWLPGGAVAQDSRDRQDLVTGRRSTLSGLVYAASFGSAAKRRELSFELILQSRMLEEYAGTDRTAWETFDRLVVSLGRRLRIYEDAATLAAGNGFATYRPEAAPRARRNRRHPVRWDVELELRRDGLDTRLAAATLWTTTSGGYVTVSPDNYVRLANPTALNGLTGMTLSYWMRNSDAVATREAVMSRGTQWQTELRSAPSAETWFVISTAGEFSGAISEDDDGAWHLWTWVYDAGDLTLYIDGAEVTTNVAGTVPATLSTVTADLTVGHTASAGPAIAGTHDVARLAIWTTAATPTQAAQIYAERRDLADGAGLTLGQPDIYMALDDLVVEGSTGGTASAVGSPVFVAGS